MSQKRNKRRERKENEREDKDQGEKEITLKLMKTAWEKLVPGMLDKFDAPAVLPLIAPRPMLVLNHELDELFPLEGAKRAAAATRVRYEAANAADHFDFRIAPGLKHAAFNLGELNGMVTWMERWLKAPAT